VNERFAAQLLTGKPARDPVAVAERLLAIQAQDARGFRLAIRARTSGLTAGDVDRALADRSLVLTWLNRGTLHLVRRQDYPWLHALTTPKLETANIRRLEQEGISLASAERGVDVVAKALAQEGPLTRAQLGDRLRRAGVGGTTQGHMHVLMSASLRGLLVRGPMVGKQHAYVHVEEWLGPQARVDLDAALAELARRYLRGHAPASERDLATWAGIPVRTARTALDAIARELREERSGLVRLTRQRLPDAVPEPKLLGAFDPVLHGWPNRGWVLGDLEPAVVTGGVFRPFALVAGRAARTWLWRDGRVRLDPPAQLSPADADALTDEAADVQRFLTGSARD
jgi:hypothetical protein